jgi:membrane associated rhomboid family serine protease
MANQHNEFELPESPYRDYESGGIALAGCFVLGTGIGFAIKPIYAIAGAIIGLGIGLIVMAWFSRDRYPNS